MCSGADAAAAPAIAAGFTSRHVPIEVHPEEKRRKEPARTLDVGGLGHFLEGARMGGGGGGFGLEVSRCWCG